MLVFYFYATQNNIMWPDTIGLHTFYGIKSGYLGMQTIPVSQVFMILGENGGLHRRTGGGTGAQLPPPQFGQFVDINSGRESRLFGQKTDRQTDRQTDRVIY